MMLNMGVNRIVVPLQSMFGMRVWKSNKYHPFIRITQHQYGKTHEP